MQSINKPKRTLPTKCGYYVYQDDNDAGNVSLSAWYEMTQWPEHGVSAFQRNKSEKINEVHDQKLEKYKKGLVVRFRIATGLRLENKNDEHGPNYNDGCLWCEDHNEYSGLGCVYNDIFFALVCGLLSFDFRNQVNMELLFCLYPKKR